MGIETSVVVDFGNAPDGTQYLFNVEQDEESNGNQTSFIIGDSVTFKVNHSENVTIVSVVATHGTVSEGGLVVRESVEEVLFASRDAANPSEHVLSVVPQSSVVEFLGRQGALTKTTPYSNAVQYTADVLLTPYRAKITSQYQCKLFTLQSPSIILAEDKTYTIDVVFYIYIVEPGTIR